MSGTSAASERRICAPQHECAARTLLARKRTLRQAGPLLLLLAALVAAATPRAAAQAGDVQELIGQVADTLGLVWGAQAEAGFEPDTGSRTGAAAAPASTSPAAAALGMARRLRHAPGGGGAAAPAGAGAAPPRPPTKGNARWGAWASRLAGLGPSAAAAAPAHRRRTRALDPPPSPPPDTGLSGPPLAASAGPVVSAPPISASAAPPAPPPPPPSPPSPSNTSTIAELLENALDKEFEHETKSDSESAGKTFNETVIEEPEAVETVVRISGGRPAKEEPKEKAKDDAGGGADASTTAAAAGPVLPDLEAGGGGGGAAAAGAVDAAEEEEDADEPASLGVGVDRIIDSQDNEFVLSAPKSSSVAVLTLDPRLVQDLTVTLGAAALFGALFESIKQPVINGYLVAGAVVGPGGLQLIKELVQVESLAQLGVQLLLFGLGRELSLSRLRPVLRVALLGGGLQILALVAIGGAAGAAIGGGVAQGLFVGAVLSMSSTSVVIKCLEVTKSTGSAYGQLTIGTLVLQDCCVGLMFALMPAFATAVARGAAAGGAVGAAAAPRAGAAAAARAAAAYAARAAAPGAAGPVAPGGELAVAAALAAAAADSEALSRLAVLGALLRVAAKLAVVVLAAAAVARTLLPVLLRRLVRHCSPELVQLSLVAFCLASAWLCGEAQLSEELGAFMAGGMVAAAERALARGGGGGGGGAAERPAGCGSARAARAASLEAQLGAGEQLLLQQQAPGQQSPQQAGQQGQAPEQQQQQQQQQQGGWWSPRGPAPFGAAPFGAAPFGAAAGRRPSCCGPGSPPSPRSPRSPGDVHPHANAGEPAHGAEAGSIRSISNVLTALFLASIGLIMSPVFLYNHAGVLLAGTLVVMVVKAAVVAGVVHAFGVPPRTAWAAGLTMAHTGEFSFVLLSMAQQLRLLPETLYMLLLGITAISLLSTPMVILITHALLRAPSASGGGSGGGAGGGGSSGGPLSWPFGPKHRPGSAGRNSGSSAGGGGGGGAGGGGSAVEVQVDASRVVRGSARQPALGEQHHRSAHHHDRGAA